MNYVNNLHRLPLLACLLITALSACSENNLGGGGIGGTGIKDTSPIEGLIIGRVDGFGSIVINDQRFETDDTIFLVDNQPANITDIQVGMSVSARIDYESGKATNVHYQPIVSGPIDEDITANGTISVLHQNITITDSTILDSFVRESLVAGAHIEVSGDRNSEHTIVANYIRMAATSEAYTVGRVANAETPENIALVSGTLFNYSTLQESSGLSPSEFETKFFAPGSTVRNGFSHSSIANGAGCMNTNVSSAIGLATNVIAINGLEAIACIWDVENLQAVPQQVLLLNDVVEIAGIATQVASQQSFVTQGRTINIDEDTRFYTRFGVAINNINTININQNDRILLKGVALGEEDVLARTIILLDQD